jgi:uncharacterized membrane-anchored protein
MELSGIGRILVVTGLVLAVLGLVLSFADRVPFLGRLPGDLSLRGDGWAIYVPLATAIVLSLLLTAALNIVAWLRR